jgi:PAS domain S-box-containing protein
MNDSLFEIFDGSDIPMWIYSRETLAFLKVNAAAIRKYGYSEQEFLTLTLLDTLPEEDVAEFKQHLAKERDEFSNAVIWRHKIKSGELRSVRVHSSGLTFHGQDSRLAVVVDTTEHVRALEEATALTERHALQSEATGDAVWDWDLVTNELQWTACATSVLGVDLSAVPATIEWWKSRIHEEDRPGVFRTLDRFLLSTETLVELEYRWVHEDGSFVEVQDRGRVVRDGSGKAIRMVGAIQDISSRRKAERLGSRMFSVSPDLMLVTDAEGRFSEVSNSCESILGIKEQELIGKHFDQFVTPEDLERTEAEWKKVLQGTPTIGFENRYISKQGTLVWLEWSTTVDNRTGFSFSVARDVTERRKNDERLRLMEMVAENTSDIVIVTDAEPLELPGHRIVYVNPAFNRVTGYSTEEIIGQSPRVLQGPQTDRDTTARMSQGLRNWLPVREEILNYTKTGEEIWLDLSIVPVANEKGWFTHWVSIERDVTERKRQEAELAASRETANRVIRSLRDALVSLDKEWRFTFLNEQAIAYLDKSFGDPMGRHVLEVLPKLAGTLQMKQIEHAVQAGIPATFDCFMPDQDRWFELRVYPYDDGVGIALMDIEDRRNVDQERRRMNSELRKTVAHLNAVRDQSLDIICSTDLFGRFLSVSRACEALWGFKETELVGKQAIDLVLRADRSKTLRAIQTVVSGKDVRNFENRVVTSGGKVIEMMWTVRLDQELGLAVFVGRDVTELNVTRRELERSLVQAQDLAMRAEAAQQAQKQFLQNMSHELRTPMNGILGIGQLLQMTPLNSEQRQFADIIIQSGESLLVILNDILDLSAAESGRIAIRQEPYIPVEIARTAVELFRSAARKQGLILDLDIAPGSWGTVIGDAFRLKQVLSNLIGNSIKFTHSGYVRVTVSLTRHAEMGELRFEVKDTGIGIPSDAQNRVFEPFYQVDMTSSRSYGGTGLGLSIVRSLVEAMGGTIGFESEVGVGTTFQFTLPVKVDPNSDPDSPDNGGPLDRGRILIVEDEPLNVEVLQLWLEHEGFRTQVATNAIRGLEEIDRTRFDLVLMDLHMPGMDGYAMLELLREADARRQRRTPVIAVTSAAGAVDRQRCLDAGFDGFVPKPVLFHALETAMRPFVKFTSV